ncbi:MAG: DNA-binding protein [Firmicutes bacterium HGW-Firmicutes-16]|nr:MAG: DNA-binding protein [Firmicutes bacterium HGW-Firmicutes-16]
MMIAAVISLCFIISANAEETVSINSLVDDAETYDNQKVTVEGEAIGEVLERGDYAWVNINDGTNAIGIWMKTSDAEIIKYFGDYKHVGDTVRITGVFSRNCTEHGGDVDIHSVAIEIVKTGRAVQDEISDAKIVIAVVLLCTAALITLIYLKITKNKKQ